MFTIHEGVVNMNMNTSTNLENREHEHEHYPQIREHVLDVFMTRSGHKFELSGP